MNERSHEPLGLGWFTNTSHPKSDIRDWCRGRPGMRIETGPPVVTDETYTMDKMRRLRIVGLYVVAWSDHQA